MKETNEESGTCFTSHMDTRVLGTMSTSMTCSYSSILSWSQDKLSSDMETAGPMEETFLIISTGIP